MSMGGKGPEVLVTLTTDFGKILDGIHRTKIRGSTHLATGIQIAHVRFDLTCSKLYIVLNEYHSSLRLNIVKTNLKSNASSSSPALQ